jgi:hypothetical protein
MLTQQLFRRDLVVATNDVHESAGELRSTGGDPHFVLKPASRCGAAGTPSACAVR